MKVALTAARVLLGLVFTIFGLNGFLQFIPAQPLTPLAGQFVGALVQSHYMTVVFALQLLCGLLLLANRYLVLALAVIAPVIVNILLFHIFLEPAGLPMALLVAALWGVLAYRAPEFAGMFHRSVGQRQS